MNLIPQSVKKDAYTPMKSLWSAVRQETVVVKDQTNNELQQILFAIGATFVLIVVLLLLIGICLLCYQKLILYKNGLNRKVGLFKQFSYNTGFSTTIHLLIILQANSSEETVNIS